jgi:hypothetical protein
MAGESLKVVGGSATGSSIRLEQEFMIGGSMPGMGSLGGDGEISRVHARVYRDASGQLTVEDLGSTTGTFVNGSRIAAATPLRPGDEVRVGHTTMAVEGGAADADATSVRNVLAAPVPPPAGTPHGPPFGASPPGGPPAAGSGGSRAPWIALAAVVLIALIVGGLAIAGVFSGDDKRGTASTTTAPPATAPATPPPTSALPEPPPENTPSSGGGYPPGFISKLIASCTRGGKLTPSQCKCWFTKLKHAYTFPQLVQVIAKAKGGKIPPKAVGLLRNCLNQ